MNGSKYWVVVVSKDHTQRGVKGGFMQACHGKQAPLKRMKKDDWVIFYSPKESMDGTERCQTFTAMGQAVDDEVFQFKMADDFIPFRRKIKFTECHETSILPLIDQLEFIRNKNSWGYVFRFGFFEINRHDFNLITSKMVN